MQSYTDFGGLCKLNPVPKKISGSRPITNVNSRPSSSKVCTYQISAKEESKITSTSGFYFKHVSEPELQAVVKRVRKANQKKRDEEEWKRFLRSKQEKNQGAALQSSCELSRGSCTECLLQVGSNRSKYSQLHEEETMKGSKDGGFHEFNSKLGTESTTHLYQLGPGLIKRLQDLLATVTKMTSLLLNPCMHSQFEDEDVDRTIKRSLEFDAMFARNHLYEIQRQLKDMKHLTATKSANTAELESKISAALKSVTVALQVYTRHVSKGAQVKYQQVVPIFQSISTLERLLEHLTGQRLFPMRQELEVSCSYMKQILLEINSTETKTVSTVSHKTVRPRNKQKPSADLSMYSRRQKAEWRKKTASLARARFGAPNTKKRCRQTESVAAKENVDEKPKYCHVEGDKTGQNISGRVCDKYQAIQQPKESTKTKGVPFRNTTRAVSEECVTTMMETIPLEKPPSRSKSDTGEVSRPVSAKSTAREANNVQLVCLTEGDTKSVPPSDQVAVDTDIDEDEGLTLTIEEADRAEALEYHQRVVDHQKSNRHYKDDKAVGIVDRLANHILTEMVRDFQEEEMDQVVRILYNLEFE